MKYFYQSVINNPKKWLMLIIVITAWMVMQLPNLRWETDARVYMPSGHPAIQYDEKIEELFGVKDALIVVIKNEQGVYNKETLARISRLTNKISKLDPVIAHRTLDVVSLSTVTIFSGSDEELYAERVYSEAPLNDGDVELVKQRVLMNADLLLGNVVSEDGTVAVIRAKIKEGANNRYQAYWQIKALVQQEQGNAGAGWGQWWSADEQEGADQQGDQGDVWAEQQGDLAGVTNGDEILLAGRPAIEVTSGLNAMEDMKTMLPLLVVVMALVLFVIFKTGRGVMLPIMVMSMAVVWTLGAMAALNVPLYTVSTMMPVILVAVGIADSVHLLNKYYSSVLDDAKRSAKDIVSSVLDGLGPPLLITTVTTGIGFLALLFAEMPPFKVFGVFTLIGVLFSWFLTIAFAGAVLVLMQPKVGGYLAKKRSLRVTQEQDQLSVVLVSVARFVIERAKLSTALLVVLVLVIGVGALSVSVNSSWMSDFRDDSEVAMATGLLNDRMSGATVLNVVLESDNVGAFKSQGLISKVAQLQTFAEQLDYVGDSISVADFMASMNKVLHAGDETYNVVPETDADVAAYYYLYSISGQPELLDEVIDYDYKTVNLSVIIQTDQTAALRNIIDSLRSEGQVLFAEDAVSINFAGSGNNSYVWADLLIQSQGAAIVFSKLAIFILALLIFRKIFISMMIVLPVTLATLIVAGGAGWLSVPLDVSTALAAGLAIGVGVDYAVHYTFRFTAELKRGLLSRNEAILLSVRSVGRAIVINAVVVMAGFSVLLLSQFPPHAKLGFFVVIYMGVSCVVALFVLPLLSILVHRNCRGGSAGGAVEARV